MGPTWWIGYREPTWWIGHGPYCTSGHVIVFSDATVFVCLLYFAVQVDAYGFERPDDFDYASYEEFMSDYLAVLARRASRWSHYLNKQKATSGDIKRSRKGVSVCMYVRYVCEVCMCVPRSLRLTVGFLVCKLCVYVMYVCKICV